MLLLCGEWCALLASVPMHNMERQRAGDGQPLLGVEAVRERVNLLLIGGHVKHPRWERRHRAPQQSRKGKSSTCQEGRKYSFVITLAAGR